MAGRLLGQLDLRVRLGGDLRLDQLLRLQLGHGAVGQQVPDLVQQGVQVLLGLHRLLLGRLRRRGGRFLGLRRGGGLHDGVAHLDLRCRGLRDVGDLRGFHRVRFGQLLHLLQRGPLLAGRDLFGGFRHHRCRRGSGFHGGCRGFGHRFRRRGGGDGRLIQNGRVRRDNGLFKTEGLRHRLLVKDRPGADQRHLVRHFLDQRGRRLGRLLGDRRLGCFRRSRLGADRLRLNRDLCLGGLRLCFLGLGGQGGLLGFPVALPLPGGGASLPLGAIDGLLRLCHLAGLFPAAMGGGQLRLLRFKGGLFALAALSAVGGLAPVGRLAAALPVGLGLDLLQGDLHALGVKGSGVALVPQGHLRPGAGGSGQQVRALAQILREDSLLRLLLRLCRGVLLGFGGALGALRGFLLLVATAEEVGEKGLLFLLFLGQPALFLLAAGVAEGTIFISNGIVFPAVGTLHRLASQGDLFGFHSGFLLAIGSRSRKTLPSHLKIFAI